MIVSCTSRIIQVTVHARGALVTRAVDVPAVSGGALELVIPGITPLADGASVRATVAPPRRITAVRTALHIPESPQLPGERLELVRALAGRLERLSAEKQRVAAHRAALADVDVDPRLSLATHRRPGHDVAARAADALATSAMLAEVIARLDARTLEIDEATRELDKQLEAARLAADQARSAERMGQNHPTRRISLTVAGDGPVDAVALSYVVPAARWWPSYTLRVLESTAATWALEAVVAQLTGEDWSGVALSLSTADLISDARLPELASRRLGRAQPPPRRAYRPAPAGLEQLFAGYDRAFAGAPRALPEGERAIALPPSADESGEFPDEALRDSDEEITHPGELATSKAMSPVQAVAAMRAPPTFALPAPGAAPTPPPTFAPQAARSLMGAVGGGAAAFAPPPPPAPAPPPSIEPADAWLDFDGLSMAGADEPRRGRLVAAAPGAAAARAVEAQRRVESLAPDRLRDPVTTRGQFDHRYDGPGGADVPSDGLPHRVTIGVADAPLALRWRSVPREATEVYREATVTNPFPGPLLAGPVEVYVEGTLLAQAAIDRVDRGGRFTVGMGVEDRLRLSRNARVDESVGGLMRGASVVETTITIELASSLPVPARVEIVDRIPVTDEKGLEITVDPGPLRSESYTQAERGSPLRRGILWTVEVPAGGKAQLAYRYVMTFPAKSELVGGSRRE